MKYKGLYFGSMILIAGIPAATATAQDREYYTGHTNSFEHRLYLTIPFGSSNIKHSLKNSEYGYSFNYKRSNFQRFAFKSHRRNFTSSLVNISFSPSLGNKINLSGVPLLRFDKFGLYADEASEGGGTGKAVLIMGGTLGLLALAVATSGEEEDEPDSEFSGDSLKTFTVYISFPLPPNSNSLAIS